MALHNSLSCFAALAMLAIVAFGVSSAPVVAEGTAPAPSRVLLELGSEKGSNRLFHPDHLEFEVGKRYTLVIENPSLETHEFDSPGLVEAAWSSGVSVLDGIGEATFLVATIVGTPAEIEVAPGGTVEWTFVAVEPGSYEMVCDTLDQQHTTHAASGMRGTVVIK
ncbi:MAG: hypothetical protein GY947_00330 [Rhodobacteraceae bacterium]|nr:hypothetical protein [Paracoccaceae bacterium]